MGRALLPEAYSEQLHHCVPLDPRPIGAPQLADLVDYREAVVADADAALSSWLVLVLLLL